MKLSMKYLLGISFVLLVQIAINSYLWGSLSVWKDPVVSIKETRNTTIHRCETIHVAFIVRSIKSLVAVLRSILFYRYSPLHFHFIHDTPIQTKLENILTTWQLPSVKYSFYFVPNVKQKVSWIPSTEYSEPYGLMKLILVSLLPLSVDRVIVLDNNITVVSDIQGLWGYFNEIRKNGKLFAVVEDLSNQYLETQSWSSKIFNTNVMLFDLQAMRQKDWYIIVWHSIIHATIRNSNKLSEQDIINSVINTYHNQYTLPCSWNVPIRSHVYRQQCVVDISEYHIVRWDFQNKMTENQEYVLYFQNINNILMQYDGYILQDTPIRCSEDGKVTRYQIPSLPRKYYTNICNDVKEQSERVFRTHQFFYGKKYIPMDEYDITLVTHLSLSHLRELQLLLNHWKGPISIAVYAKDIEVLKFAEFMKTSGVLKRRKNLAIHIVYQRGYLYPINYLRNIALNAVSTPYVFLSDGDLLPMYNLYSLLKRATKTLMNVPQRRALVVPGFESVEYTFHFPHNKSDVLNLMHQNTITTMCPYCKSDNNAPTDIERWAKSSKPYRVDWKMNYQPYVVVKSDVVRYDQRFVGYGFNKASHIMELKAQLYEFIVLPDVFIIHTPHPSSNVKDIWHTKDFKFCIDALWDQFKKEIVEKYGHESLSYKKEFEMHT